MRIPMNAGKRELVVYSMLCEWMKLKKTPELSYQSVKLSSRHHCMLTRLDRTLLGSSKPVSYARCNKIKEGSSSASCPGHNSHGMSI